MFDPSIFHPRRKDCKAPFGAIAAGEKTTLTIYPPRRAGYSAATLIARWEQRDNQLTTHPMPWCSHENGADVFSTTLAVGDYVGLIFYAFRLDGLDGRTLQSQEYQLTVYDGSEEVPQWFGSGMSYQIFPDRFCCLETPSLDGLPDRWLHQNWDEAPAYRPDHTGEIRNRDFFGGSLAGITAKLPYLQGLGVETIYLCPIFEGPENHRYGTADYEKIDPLLGCEADFTTLCDSAHALGLRVILDGVFNHVSAISRYFNADGSYGDDGGARRHDSQYREWFSFTNWPDQYHSWWGFASLPTLNGENPAFRSFLCEGPQSIIRRWLAKGADGWRLDVADELTDGLVALIHQAARAEKPHATILGEVWEDGSTKIAYDVRRAHIWGGHCDGLMNYPLRTALLTYLGGGDASQFEEDMETLREHYPPFAYHNAMNFLGTHDTPRAITLLGTGTDGQHQSKDWRGAYTLSPLEYQRGATLLKLGMLLLFAFPGSPTVYYGDEAGLAGFEDPFNRGTYPWGQENQDLLTWVRALGNARKTLEPLRQGKISYLAATDGLLAFARTHNRVTVVAATNRGDTPQTLTLPWKKSRDVLSAETFHTKQITLPPQSGYLLIKA